MDVTKRTIAALFQHPAGLRYHGLALVYALLAYGVGFYGLFGANWYVNAGSVILLGHGMTIAAYLIHECAHNTVFKNNDHNARLGTFLTWICGACYGTYEDIRYKHFRHHVDNDDVVWFDYEAFFDRHPLILRVTRFLEWFYIPAHDLLMHGVMVMTSFIIPQRRDQRARNLVAIVVRGGLFVALCWVFPKVAVLYATAYMLMITVLRFMDSIQHDYGYRTNLFEGERSPHKGDSDWEQEHTFSPMISFTRPWANWLVLNFTYHNAHHAKPTTPWFELPRLHGELFGDDPANIIPLGPQLLIFHRHRVARVRSYPPRLREVEGAAFLQAAQRAQVVGGNAASFLTSF
ncbi:MAG: fatty acid desaturase [Pseudomonadales bacterium]